MQSKLLAIVFLASAVAAAPENKRRQATDPAQFSSAANQLISAYIPASVALPLGAAVLSAASASGITGDANSIVQSALAESTPPAFLTAIPSEYQPNIASLQSAISALRGVASSGIPGAPVISVDSTGGVVTTGTLNAVTTTDTAGSTIVGVTGPVTDSAGSTVPSLTSTIAAITSIGLSSVSQPSGVTTTDSAGSTITGVAIVTTDSAGSTITSLASTLTGAATTTTSAVSTTTTTSETSTTETSTSATTSGTTSTTTATSAAPATTTTSAGAAAPAALAPGVGGLLGLLGLALAL